MIERIVENWLISTNERGYQIPFCQCLISEGYTLLEVSSHTQSEQGKDIVALDCKGRAFAYQLKTGLIDKKEWNKIKSEIDDLIEIPIKHTSVKASVKPKCFLVTNGRITGKVKTDIYDRNIRYKKNRLPELHIIQQEELLKRFLNVNGKFLPTGVPEIKLFLELFMANGREMIDKDTFAQFLESSFCCKSTNHLELKRRIASNILLAQYIIDPYELKENHVSIVEAWVMVASYILMLADKYNLPEADWKPSFAIILDKVSFQLGSLKKEFLSRTNFIESDWDGALFYKARITLVLGWLASYELYLSAIDVNYTLDRNILNAIQKNYKDTWFWGESATPLFIAMSELLLKSNESYLSNKIICDLIIDINNKNQPGQTGSLPDPYYSAKKVLNHFYGPHDEKLDLQSFSGSSYHLVSLVNVLVKRNKRNLLQEIWSNVSMIINTEVAFNNASDFFRWQFDEGREVLKFFDKPQSWKSLQEGIDRLPEIMLPRVIMNNPFVYYFFLCYPHRFNKNSMVLMQMN